MSPGTKITVRARIVGQFDGQPVNASGMVGLKAGDNVKKFFKKADAALGLKGRKPFRRAFNQGIRPVALLNGDRLELPEESARPLSDGDEISIILPVAGG